MSNIYEVFNIKSDLQLNSILTKLDLDTYDMINLNDIIDSNYSISTKRKKIMELMSSISDNNYMICENLFKTSQRVLKEDVEPYEAVTPSHLNMNQAIQLNSLFELASKKFQEVDCSQAFYQMLSQKLSKNFANAFFNTLKSCDETSDLKYNPELTVDGKNFAETIFPLVNELTNYLNSCKKESTEKVNEGYNDGEESESFFQFSHPEDLIDDYKESMPKLYKLLFRMKSIKPLLVALERHHEKMNDMKNFKALLSMAIECVNPNSEYVSANPKATMKMLCSLNNTEQSKIADALCDIIIRNSSEDEYYKICNEIKAELNNKKENLKESLEDTLNNFKYYISTSNSKDELNYIKSQIQILFSGSNSTEDRNKLSELLSMINTKLSSIKPRVDECCCLDSLLEPFKATVINLTVNDSGNLIDCEKETAKQSLKSLASHVNDVKDPCPENNIENMQTISSLLSSLASYFHKRICETKLNEGPISDKFQRGLAIAGDKIHNAGVKTKQAFGLIDDDDELRSKFIEYLIRVYMVIFDKKQDPNCKPMELVNYFAEQLIKADSKFQNVHNMVMQRIKDWVSDPELGRTSVATAIKNQLAHLGIPDEYIRESWKEFMSDKDLKPWSSLVKESVNESANEVLFEFSQEELEDENFDEKLENAITSVQASIDDFDSYDDEMILSFCKDAGEEYGVDYKKVYYYITGKKLSALEEDTVFDHSWYEVEGQKYPKRTKDGVEINEMCSGGATCAGAVATVPSPAKPKSPKRKHKKSKVDEMALNMFKKNIIEGINGQIETNGNHYEYRDGYFYINGDIAKTTSKYMMLEALDEQVELETLKGFNSQEMLMLEDIEANSSAGNEQNNEDNQNDQQNQDNSQQPQQTPNVNQDNLGDVNQNVTQDMDLTPEQRQLKKDTQKVLDQKLSTSSDTDVSVNNGFDNNNDQQGQNQQSDNIKYKLIGKDDADPNNIKYIIQDPTTKKTQIVDATKLRLEK